MRHLGRTALLMVRRGEAAVLWEQLKLRIHSDRTSLVLRCELEKLPPPPACKIPLTVRKLEERDIPIIVRERPRRLGVLLEDVPTCYVGETEEGHLAYMQWAVLSQNWPRFKPFFSGSLFRPLYPDEVLLEFAYTFEAFRGMGVMGAAMRAITAQYQAFRYAYTYVLADNIPSLKGCKNAGYRPYVERREFYRRMRMSEEFSELPLDARYSFEE